MTTIPLKAKWFQMHREHCFVLNSKSFKSILVGDSLIAELHRYCKIWNNFFKSTDVYLTAVWEGKKCKMFYGECRIYRFLLPWKMSPFCAVPTIYIRILQRILFMALLGLDIVLKNETITLISLFAGYPLVMNGPL